MDLKTGYKQTEIGVIPNDWEVKKLGEVLKVIGGGAFKSTDNSRIGIKWLKIANVGINQAVWNEENYLPLDLVKENQNFLLHEGDYVIALTRPILDKKLKITKLTKNDVPALLNQRVGKIEVEKDNDNDFAYFLFQKSGTINALLQSMAGTDPPNLSNKGIYNIDCALPPTLIEQTAIATALSDADGLITGLEKLIAKKRNIKQGTMQQLLQPKEGWEVKTLKELAKYRRGSFPQPYGLDKWYDDNYGMPFVQVYDVDDNFKLKNETKRKISKEAQAMSVYIKKGSVIITLQGSIGRIAITQYDAYVDRTLLFFESFLEEFDKYFFLLSIFLLFEKEKEKAPGGIIKTITKEALSSFTIAYPNVKEQTRIASILFDMDAELSALEQKLEKYKKVKLGMMQELLTGKTRLV